MSSPRDPHDSDAVSVLFVDLRNFTFLLDRYDSEYVLTIVDELFREIHAAVDANDGRVDKLIGDGLMAVFDTEQSEQRAVECGIETLERRVPAAQEKSDFDEIKVGIGIGTGAAHRTKLADVDETVVGSCVNVAARLQELCKKYDVPMLIDETTRRQVPALPEGYTFRQIPEQDLRGIVDPVDTYQPWNIERIDTEYVGLFDDGIRKLKSNDYKGALQSFIRAYTKPERYSDQALLDHFTSRCFDNLNDTNETFQNADQYERNSTTQEEQSVDLFARVNIYQQREELNAARILDVGCGTGKVTEKLARQFPEASIVGIDESISQVYKAREQHSPDAFDITYRHDPIEYFQSDAEYDLIVSNSVMHWVEEQEQAYRNMRDAIADDGLLAIHQGHEGCYIELREAAWDAVESCGFEAHFTGFSYPLIYHTKDDVRELLARTNFDPYEIVVSDSGVPDTIVDDFAEAGLRPFIDQLDHEHQEKVFVDRFKSIANDRLSPTDITAQRLYVLAEPIATDH